MVNKIYRIHNHPQLERELGVPEGHVIIDADLYLELVNRHGPVLFKEEHPIPTPIKGEN